MFNVKPKKFVFDHKKNFLTFSNRQLEKKNTVVFGCPLVLVYHPAAYYSVGRAVIF